MDEKDGPIPISTHPAWKGTRSPVASKTPEFIRGPIQDWSETRKGPWKALSISVGPTAETAITGEFLVPQAPNDRKETARHLHGQMLERAYRFGHEVQLNLFTTPQGTIMIAKGTDISETLLSNGPFGSDRETQRKNGEDSSVSDFLKTAGNPYALSRNHVAKLWNWPRMMVPDMQKALPSFAHISPRDIDDTTEGQHGMAVAIITGSIETLHGDPNALTQRLRSAQGRWDLLGKKAGEDGAALIQEVAFHRLPILTGMAAGLSAKEDNDITLARAANQLWPHMQQGLLQSFTKGPLMSVLERAQTLEAPFAENDALDDLYSMEDGAKYALNKPTEAKNLLAKSAQALGQSIDAQQTGTDFLAKFLVLPNAAPKTRTQTPDQER